MISWCGRRHRPPRSKLRVLWYGGDFEGGELEVAASVEGGEARGRRPPRPAQRPARVLDGSPAQGAAIDAREPSGGAAHAESVAPLKGGARGRDQ